MICYPDNLTPVEILAINEYWRLSETSEKNFRKTVTDIDKEYQSLGARKFSKIGYGKFLIPYSASFWCSTCRKPMPAYTRTHYIEKIKSSQTTCEDCNIYKMKKENKEALSSLKDYRRYLLKEFFDISELNFLETIYFLLIYKRNGLTFGRINYNFKDISFSGSKEIDEKYIHRLKAKGAVTEIKSIPTEYREKEARYFENAYKIREDRHKEVTLNSLSNGKYINVPKDFNNQNKKENFYSLLSHLDSIRITKNELNEIERLIKTIQAEKIYAIFMENAKDERIIVGKSVQLSALISYLSENYSPLVIDFTVWIKSREVATKIMQENIPGYISKHYLTKYVSSFIQQMEQKEITLDKKRIIPPFVHTSAVEVFLCKRYFEQSFSWNSFSTKDILAHWMRQLPNQIV